MSGTGPKAPSDTAPQPNPVAARRGHGHHAAMPMDKDDLPHDWLDDGAVDPRFVRLAWEEAARLTEHPDYAALRGTPTMRERAVALARDIADAIRLPAMPASRRALAAAAVVAAFVAVWALTPHSRGYATQVAEVRDIPLTDGSTVTLGARSKMDVAFTDVERTVRLNDGEAFFSVAHNAQRPFIVLVGDKRVRVVGTKFNVRYDGARVRVSVLEGVVEVSQGKAPADAPADQPRLVKLVAGQQLLASDAAPLHQPEPLHGAVPGAWRGGRLDYQDAPLSEIVADANRYSARPIRIASPALAGERLTTSFRTTQIDQMLETLPQILPVSVRRDADGSVRLEASGHAAP
ncbi:MAG: FecR family protein [Pseudomonadota bacterium]